MYFLKIPISNRNLQNRWLFFSRNWCIWQFKDVIRKITFNIDAESECREDHPSFWDHNGECIQRKAEYLHKQVNDAADMKHSMNSWQHVALNTVLVPFPSKGKFTCDYDLTKYLCWLLASHRIVALGWTMWTWPYLLTREHAPAHRHIDRREEKTAASRGHQGLLQILPKLATFFQLVFVGCQSQYGLSLLNTYSQSAFRNMFTEEPHSDFHISVN